MATAPLPASTGAALDPIFAMRRRVPAPGGGMARVTFWTLAAESSDQLPALVDHHRDALAFERAETPAWTKAQVQLRHLDLTSAGRPGAGAFRAAQSDQPALSAFRVDITVTHGDGAGHGVKSVLLDGDEIVRGDGPVRLPVTTGTHRAHLTLGSTELPGV